MGAVKNIHKFRSCQSAYPWLLKLGRTRSGWAPGGVCGSGAASVPALRKTSKLEVTPTLAQRLVPLPGICVALKVQTIWTLQNSAFPCATEMPPDLEDYLSALWTTNYTVLRALDIPLTGVYKCICIKWKFTD